MKIIGGTLKNRNFFMPASISPTQNLVRKALFDILGQDMSGIRFLEVFAGSGAVGFEAFSRGASEVVLVEKDPKHAEIIHQNIEQLEIVPYSSEAKLEVLNSDGFATIKAMADRGRKFDIVFADPPYGLDLAKKTLKTLGSHDILHANSHVVIQHAEQEKLPQEAGNLSLIKQKRYGRNLLSFYQPKEESQQQSG